MSEKEMNRPIIVITDADYYAPGFVEEKMPRLLAWGEIRLVQTKDEAELIEALSKADVAVIRRVRMTREVFAACPRLLGVAKMGAGVEKIDIPAATEHRVIVANSPVVTIAVAEAALLLMMTLTKPLLVMIEKARKGEPPPPEARGTELYGKTLGIVGFGRIGFHLGKIAQGMGMTVLVHDPYVSEAPGFNLLDLPDLLRRSDFVSLNCPVTPETHHLIGEQELRLMKPTAYLINTSRGGVVNEAALVKALKKGWLRGVGLDVVENEPVSPDNPLFNFPNVVITPHALARTWESMDKVVVTIQDAVDEILQGGMPEYALNPSIERKPSPYAK